MGEVVKLNCLTTLPIPANDVLNGALDKLDYVLVLGWEKDGTAYMASPSGNMNEAAYVTTRFLHKMHDGSLG